MSKTEDIELYNILKSEPIVRKPMITDGMFKLIEKDFEKMEQEDWPDELKMYFKLYGKLVYDVPHYINLLVKQKTILYEKIFDIPDKKEIPYTKYGVKFATR